MGIVALAGLALSAYSQYQAGQAEGDMADYNARVAKMNQKAEEQKSLLESRRLAKRASEKMHSLRASLGGSGAVTTAGAPLKLQEEQAKESEEDVLMAGFRGQTAAARQGAKAKQYKYQASSSRRLGALKAGSTILTGVGSQYDV